MRSPCSLKQEFLQKWLMGLQVCHSSMKDMSALERKKVIKLSADIAMASSRNGTTSWSRALIANASKGDKGEVLVPRILSNIRSERLLCKKVPFMGSKTACHKKIFIRSKKILKRASRDNAGKRARRRGCVNLTCSIAKRLLKKRTQVLKSLVPGGEFMDEVSLIRESLDYIVSLRAQVDVMRSLADATMSKRITNQEHSDFSLS